ncbi:Misato Segment II, myosin-like protein [Cynara cardunculus var. scolymus]|uniref:Misato Segment II, myosin-like protein n=1 Tax=Cynara cardunculus var. scolymus TaxID=59895 RepID=A0A103XL61_CYNCS|nr:Misato Segment II, myosin-like protein [Cynara cardunculus var. scolymus]
MKELVTFQVGSYANFIGSHFWNFQDELLGLVEDAEADLVFKNQNIDMDVLYRTGENHQGMPTYTPRLISVDFQGSLGSMSSHGTLYNQNSSLSSGVTTWLYDEGQEIGANNANGIDKASVESHSEILDTDVVKSLEDGVQFWTDFSKVHYHPQSLFELNGLWMGAQEFNNYRIGRDTVSEGLQGDEINERLRFFVEECDHVQGIQFIVDDSGGYSGVAASLLENIEDEYTNVPVLLYSVRSPDSYTKAANRKQVISRKLHDAVSFSALSSLCKLIVPLGLPSLSENRASQFLNLQNEKPYHSSAVYASAIHSITLPFRMKRVGPAGESLNESGAMDLYEGIQIRFRLVNLQPLTPETAHDVEDLQAIESMVVHGVLGAVREAVETAYENTSTRPRFSHVSVSRCPLPIPLPFPSIFGNLVGRRGELLSNPQSGSGSGSGSRGSLDVHSIPMAARLRSTTAVLPFLENRLNNIHKLGIERGSIGADVLRDWGFGKEEVEEIGESISKMVLALDPQQGYSSDSD